LQNRGVNRLSWNMVLALSRLLGNVISSSASFVSSHVWFGRFDDDSSSTGRRRGRRGTTQPTDGRRPLTASGCRHDDQSDPSEHVLSTCGGGGGIDGVRALTSMSSDVQRQRQQSDGEQQSKHNVEDERRLSRDRRLVTLNAARANVCTALPVQFVCLSLMQCIRH